MKIRCDTTLISAVILSICLVTQIPAAVRNVSTWQRIFLEWPGVSVQNFMAPFGFVSIGFVIIGLIVLWVGFRKKERWAWFVMLTIPLCFDFPSTALPVLLEIRKENYRWSLLLTMLETVRDEGVWHCFVLVNAHSCCGYSVGVGCIDLGILTGILRLLVMLVFLLIPIKAFFRKSAKDQAS